MSLLTLHPTAFTNWLATCCSRSTSSLRALLRIDMGTSTTVNGLKFSGSTPKRAMLTHESSNMAAHRTLLQSCVRNLIVVSLAISSRPHDHGFCQGEKCKVQIKISAVTVYVYEYSTGPSA